jgi:integrase
MGPSHCLQSRTLQAESGRKLPVLKSRALDAKREFAFPSPEDPKRPIGSVRKAHDAAVGRANIVPAFRLYDLQHTYASRAVMAGVDLPTLQLCSGTRAFR